MEVDGHWTRYLLRTSNEPLTSKEQKYRSKEDNKVARSQ